MNSFTHVPPGFRFHPTDEELVDYYLRKKVASRKIDLDVIKDVDLYKIEPWDLQDRCKIGAEEQSDWYFFSHKDKKYPTGTRTNRATTAGFWKATGRDKPIYSKHNLVGMRKTLVFYKGRAPNGQKSDWIMHEYRLETNENAPPQEEGWVVCRVFKKRVTAAIQRANDGSPCWYDDIHVSFMPVDVPHSDVAYQNCNMYSCKSELETLHYNNLLPNDPLFLSLPHLESPKPIPNCISHGSSSSTIAQSSMVAALEEQTRVVVSVYNSSDIQLGGGEQVTTDWRVLDKFVASQLSQDKDPNYSDHSNQVSNKEYASTSNSSSQIDLWKL